MSEITIYVIFSVYLFHYVFVTNGAVLKFEDGVLKRISRSPHCWSCEQDYGPSQPYFHKYQYGPHFHTQQWSGLAHSSDGTQQQVFSGASASADGDTRSADGSEAISIASSSSTGNSENGGKQPDRGSEQYHFNAEKESDTSSHVSTAQNSENLQQQQISSNGKANNGNFAQSQSYSSNRYSSQQQPESSNIHYKGIDNNENADDNNHGSDSYQNQIALSKGFNSVAQSNAASGLRYETNNNCQEEGTPSSQGNEQHRQFASKNQFNSDANSNTASGGEYRSRNNHDNSFQSLGNQQYREFPLNNFKSTTQNNDVSGANKNNYDNAFGFGGHGHNDRLTSNNNFNAAVQSNAGTDIGFETNRKQIQDNYSNEKQQLQYSSSNSGNHNSLQSSSNLQSIKSDLTPISHQGLSQTSGSYQGNVDTHGSFGNQQETQPLQHKEFSSVSQTDTSSFNHKSDSLVDHGNFDSQKHSNDVSSQSSFESQSSYNNAKSGLSNALSLASQSLQASQDSKTECSTCQGKGSFAYSNAKSNSGSAIAVSVNGK